MAKRQAGLKAPKKQSRPQRWAALVAEARERLDALSQARDDLKDSLDALGELRQEYEEWKDSLPDNLQGSSLADKLETVCGIDFESADIDLDELTSLVDEAEGVELPLGFGRD
jgi:hypothetical protein